MKADSVKIVWGKALPKISKYHLEVATDTGFAAVSLEDSALTDTSRMVRDLTNGQTLYWRVRAGNAAGWGSWSATRMFTVKITGTPVLGGSGLAGFFAAGIANGDRTLEYTLTSPVYVECRLYSLLGRPYTLIPGARQQPGAHQATLSARLPRGTYVMVLKIGRQTFRERVRLWR